MAEDTTNNAFQPGGRIGKYEILEHIASGGMGVVYKARDVDLDRAVALKLLPAALAKEKTTLIRFQREARAAAHLRHDNIVSIYDIGEAGGAHYIALEYVEGADLQAYISRKCRLTSNEARYLLIQATKALVHAHEKGIVHRDIKPSNFLLMFEEKEIVLKLTDFGLAIRHESDQEFRITRDKTTVGTVDYMAPEQACDSRSADIRSDIYSLGCTFYHMLAGQAPFARGTLPERILQHMQAPAPDVRKFNKNVSPPLVAILERMLEKKPADRYQTPAELLHDLENIELVSVPSKVAKGPGRGDMTAVIEKDALDEPRQVKKTRAKREAPEVDESADDADAEERATPELQANWPDEENDEQAPKAARKPKKPASAKTSPIWLFAAAGSVFVLAIVLIIAFASGNRNPPKEPEKKDDKPIVVNLDKRVEPPPPIDTSPDKMTVEAPLLPKMDAAKIDVAALKKEYYGPFMQFPGVPEKTPVIQVRRLATPDTQTVATLAEAIAQMKPNQATVIEIADQGPLFVAALPALPKCNLVLRGADGYRPVIVWDIPRKAEGVKLPGPFLTMAGGGLSLDNVDFVLKWSDDSPGVIFDLNDANFHARNCTISVAGHSPRGIALIRRRGLPGALDARKSQTWLQRCYVRGHDSILLRHENSPGELMIEESLVVGQHHPLIEIQARDDDSFDMHCVRSTLVTGQVLVRWQAPKGQRVTPRFQARVLDSILSRDDVAASLGDMVQLHDVAELERMRWRAANSLYAGWKKLLAWSGKDLADLEAWRGQWLYTSGDRFVADPWPLNPPSTLEDQNAATFLPAKSPVAYSALTASTSIGCVVGRLPPAPEGWQARTMEAMTVPTIQPADIDPPRLESSVDGAYAGERLDLNKVDLGDYLNNMLQKTKPAPRVVMHLAGKGVCTTSPLRVKGVQNLVLYFEPAKDAKDSLILEVNPTKKGPLFEMAGGHLEIIGARLRLSPVTFVPTLVHAQNADLTLSRCWLQGPLVKSPDSFKSLITVANTASQPATLLMRSNVAVSGKQLIHLQDNVVLKARNNALVSLGDGVVFDINGAAEPHQHLLDRNTWAVRQTVFQLRTGPSAELPRDDGALLHSTNNAFLRPFLDEPEKGVLARGFESWTHQGRWTWQGRFNVFDARLHAFHGPLVPKSPLARQPLKDWQRTWGPVGEFDPILLDGSLATKELTLDGLTPPALAAQLERLVLPRTLRVDLSQGFPGADLVAIGILKKKN